MEIEYNLTEEQLSSWTEFEFQKMKIVYDLTALQRSQWTNFLKLQTGNGDNDDYVPPRDDLLAGFEHWTVDQFSKYVVANRAPYVENNATAKEKANARLLFDQGHASVVSAFQTMKRQREQLIEHQMQMKALENEVALEAKKRAAQRQQAELDRQEEMKREEAEDERISVRSARRRQREEEDLAHEIEMAARRRELLGRVEFETRSGGGGGGGGALPEVKIEVSEDDDDDEDAEPVKQKTTQKPKPKKKT